MSTKTQYFNELKQLIEAYGVDKIAGLLGKTSRGVSNWVSEDPKTPHPNTQLAISELFRKFKAGELVELDPADFKDKYMRSLEDQIATLKSQVNLLTAEMRHIILINQAIAQTNRDLLIEIIAKQRKVPLNELKIEVGKALSVNYEKARKRDIVVDVGK